MMGDRGRDISEERKIREFGLSKQIIAFNDSDSNLPFKDTD